MAITLFLIISYSVDNFIISIVECLRSSVAVSMRVEFLFEICDSTRNSVLLLLRLATIFLQVRCILSRLLCGHLGRQLR
jgi:hypothetical protein